jgi:hypothetical protein
MSINWLMSNEYLNFMEDLFIFLAYFRILQRSYCPHFVCPCVHLSVALQLIDSSWPRKEIFLVQSWFKFHTFPSIFMDIEKKYFVFVWCWNMRMCTFLGVETRSSFVHYLRVDAGLGFLLYLSFLSQIFTPMVGWKYA